MSSWSIAIRNFRRRKLRTSLTISGVAIGIAMMLSLLSIVSGMEVASRQMIRALGGADIIVYNGTMGGRGTLGPPFEAARTLNESLTLVIGQVSGVYAITAQLSFIGYINGTRVVVIGIDPATYLTVTGGLNVVEGAFISGSEAHEAVIGKALADALDLKVGERLVIEQALSKVEFTAVGIFETGVQFQDNVVYIPLRVAQRMTNQSGLVTQILVKCFDPSQANSISNTISTLVPGVRVVVQAAMVQRASEVINALAMFFATIGLAALSAGCLGVANTMFMSISERTREIGIMKSMGAKDPHILRMFISEALLIGLIGGAIGVIVGALISHALPLFIQGAMTTGRLPTGGRGIGGVIFSPVITPTNIALCLALGVAVGAIAGLYPAWRAARMKPVEALRHV